jgi:hypothetical protein
MGHLDYINPLYQYRKFRKQLIIMNYCWLQECTCMICWEQHFIFRTWNTASSRQSSSLSLTLKSPGFHSFLSLALTFASVTYSDMGFNVAIILFTSHFHNNLDIFQKVHTNLLSVNSLKNPEDNILKNNHYENLKTCHIFLILCKRQNNSKAIICHGHVLSPHLYSMAEPQKPSIGIVGTGR